MWPRWETVHGGWRYWIYPPDRMASMISSAPISVDKLRRRILMETNAGFTLIELAMVMFIFALLLGIVLPMTSAAIDVQKRNITEKKLKVVETALTNFVAIHKRLPCPADGASSNGLELRTPATANYTVDCAAPAAAANTNQQTGVVPWTTLGITMDSASDGWDRLLTYRVAFGLTRDNAMDMSACDPAGTGQTRTFPGGLPGNIDETSINIVNESVNTDICDPQLACSGTGTACTMPKRFLKNKGFRIVDRSNAVLADPVNLTGAAYVVISHGENGLGAYTRSQVLMTTAVGGVSGPLEDANQNGTLAVSAASTNISPAFRDSEISTAGALYFDDLMSRPSVFAVIQSAQTGPRSH
jgi:prepilin-type N-terminal cleavage/methylation domain-containing protein